MPPQDSGHSRLAPGIAERAAELRQFNGGPQEFWPAFLELTGRAIGAVRAVLVRRETADDARWKQAAEWSAPDASAAGLALFRNALLALADDCARDGVAKKFLTPDGKSPEERPAGLAVRLVFAGTSDTCLVALYLPKADAATLEELALRVQLLADVPQSYQEHSTISQARNDVEKFAVVFDTLAQVNAQQRFVAGALAVCNSLASRLKCRQVSLGWFADGFVRLQAISRMERFDRKSAAVQTIEKAMEEAVDQDDEILWPPPANYALVTRDHAAMAKENNLGSLCSVPMRIDGKVRGAITLERESGEFTPVELQQLRLCADQVAPRLRELKRRDRWVGARLLDSTRDACARLVGPEHTWAKAAVVLTTVVLVLLCVIKMNYRVDAKFILRSKEVRYITAPFGGYLREVSVRPGDIVTTGAALLRLNTDDLLLEEAGAIAEMNRYQRESEKARAANQLAEMRVATAQMEEARAKLGVLRYRIERAELKSPFDAVVVEGDLRSRLGTPVQQGDPLLRLARTDALYVEAEVNERDVHEVLAVQTGEIAFISQPAKTYSVRVERVEPASVTKDGKNVFVMRCAVEGRMDDWWRPGMSGECRINVGDRRILWILTHRTVDFLRLYFWW